MDGQPKKIYLYARLSEEEEKHGDSISIINQRTILTRYAEENKLVPYEFIYDDGYTGTNQDRPAFAQMLADVEAGLVSTIVVKDLSRLGRNYLQVGMLMEITLPRMDVRLIALHDNVDSDRGENDFVPMLNFFNELHVKSTSKKVRAVFQAKGKSGQRLTGTPPYGYRKDPDNTKQIIIDEESAAVVRRIFQMTVEGNGPTEIARRLSNEGILCPSVYKREAGVFRDPRNSGPGAVWHKETVSRILGAQEYLGRAVIFKTYTKSYKDKRRFHNPEEKQLVFEGMHPAIVDEATWNIVQRLRQHKHRSPRYGNPGLFAGVAFCADCGSKLYAHTANLTSRKGYECFRINYTCSKYAQTVSAHFSDTGCTRHCIREDVLTEIVLEELKELLDYVSQHTDAFTQQVMAKAESTRNRELAALKRALEKHRRRVADLDTLFERMYEDHVVGKLSDERYQSMSAKYDGEQRTLKQEIIKLEAALSADAERAKGVYRFIDTVKQHPVVDELTPAVVHKFIEKIIVFEAEGKGLSRAQRVDIVFNGVGAIDMNRLLNRISS